MGAGSGRLTLDEMTLLAEAASDVSFTAAMDGRTTWVSPGVRDLLGWSPADMVDRPFLDFVHPDDQADVQGGRARADTGQIARFRARVRDSAGAYHWMDILLRTRVDTSGVPQGRFGSWRDADDLVRLEAGLESEARHGRVVLDGMLDPWVEFTPVRDGDGRIIDFLFADANARACEYNRMTREDLVGSHLLDLLPAHRGSDLFESYVRVMETGQPLVLADFVYPREIFGGAERRYDIQAVRIDGALSYTWRDVTERFEGRRAIEQSAAQLAAGLESEIDPHIFVSAVRDDQGTIVDLRYEVVNAAAATYLGRSAEMLRGVTTSSMGSPAFAAFTRVVAPVIDTGAPAAIRDWETPTLHGPSRVMEMNVVKVGDGASIIWRDVTDVHLANQRLAQSEALLAAAMDSDVDDRLIVSPIRDEAGEIVDFRVVAGNAAAAEYFSGATGEIVGATFRQLAPLEAAEWAIGEIAGALNTGEPWFMKDYPAQAPGRKGRLIEGHGVLVGGDLVSLVWRDITEHTRMVEALAESEERYRLLSANASELIALWREGICVWASPSTLTWLGMELDQVIGLDARLLVHEDDRALFEATDTAAAAGTPQLVRLRLRLPDGTVHWVEIHAGPYVDGEGRDGYVLTSSRIVDDIVEIEQELEHRARFDLLTGLLNRSEVLHTVARLSAQRPRTGELTALLFCDIDRFKDINDTHGHAAGDEVLRTLGERLASTIRSDDYAARIGGDELLVVLTGVHDLDEATRIAEKVRTVAAEPIAMEHGVRITPTLSIGVTLAHPGETTDQLVERADNAMYDAKRAGRNRVVAIG